ncbi:sulfite exporter TauE/SafE family protein [Paenibacillaceae bacterium]|nr:sulfite exporter TauE/SafE family protein [Paenibacillaceae bacterium]
MDIQLIASMFALGLLLGFVGAGGSGFIIAILTTGFGFPIHAALGTALATMLFTSLSGTVSHFREGNVVVRTGLVVGLTGAAGAWAGSQVAIAIPGEQLKWFTSGSLLLSGLALWFYMFYYSRRSADPAKEAASNKAPGSKGMAYWLGAAALGLVTGALSGAFGIGSTPFIQIGLLALLGLSIAQAAGTTMLVILPIAAAGGASYYGIGYFDAALLLKVLLGTMIGSYIGAKFTKRVPRKVLRTAMVLMPIAAAILLVIEL